jgi:hypothetical protein
LNLLSRFIFDKNQYSTERNEAKYNAFLPQPQYPNELSVYEVSDLLDKKVWDLALHVRVDKTVKARADFLTVHFQDKSNLLLNRLTLENDQDPHPRHCNIKNFPTDKSEQILTAMELASISTLKLNTLEE